MKVVIEWGKRFWTQVRQWPLWSRFPLRHWVRRHPRLSWSFAGAIALMLAGYLGLLVYIQIRLAQLPDVKSLTQIDLEVPLRIFDRNGELLGEFGGFKRNPIDYAQIPPAFIKAFLAAEDDEFFEHSGVDYSGLLRSVLVNIRRNKKAQGASTITMQLARNQFLKKEKTWRRKRDEIILAWKIEETFPKEKILELYLNKIYFGNRAYGISSAAKIYYDKNINELTLAQMAMIAGMPQRPSLFNPIANPKRATQRRNHILKRMRELGYIDTTAYQSALQYKDNSQLHGSQMQNHLYYLGDVVRAELKARFGDKAKSRGYQVYTTIDNGMQKAAYRALQNGLLAYDRRHGYRGAVEHIDLDALDNEVYWDETLAEIPEVTGLIPALVVDTDQTLVVLYHPEIGRFSMTEAGWAWVKKEEQSVKAAELFKKGDIIYVQNRDEAWWLSQPPRAEAAVVAMNPKNGAILAMVGGYDYFRSNYNRATSAARQPGSNFKPFIYSAALEKGFSTASIVNDAPIEDEWWRPHNANYEFEGPMSIRRGLAKSKNMIAIRLLRDIGVDYALQYVKRFGFDAGLPNDLTLALGTGEVTPLNLVQGFSVFANGGYAVQQFIIDKITDSEGKVLAQTPETQLCDSCLSIIEAGQNNGHNTNAQIIKALEMDGKRVAPRVISPQNAYLVTSMMQDVINYGTAVDAKVLNRADLAGKTGTTNEQKDAWFSGFNHEIAATVWVGFDDPKTLGFGEYGGTTALPIWVEFMRHALQSIPQAPFALPDRMTMVRIDPKTGKRACQGESGGVFEPFRVEEAPKECSEAPPQDGENGGNDDPFSSS